MPYNTRRKSLSLSELGIVLPKRSRAHSHSSPPSTAVDGGAEPPIKKSKRSHPSASPPPSNTTSAKNPARNSVTTLRFKEDKPNPSAELSPPPSPVVEGRNNRVDVEGINDDIVVATIRQLEQTGNRPHLVKELAAILATSLDSAEKSTNPTALISSRLTAYINRPWPAVCPCPLAKDLTTAHPRRLYFYLTTLPRQPLPPSIDTLANQKSSRAAARRIISPSLSSASSNNNDGGESDSEENDRAETDRLLRQRQALSPSPEVDLSSPDLYPDGPVEEPSPGAPFSGRSSVGPRERSASGSGFVPAHGHGHGGRRGGSPPLERDERDFKLTATAVYEEVLKQRRRSGQEQREEEEKREKKARSGSAESRLSASSSSGEASASPASENGGGSDGNGYSEKNSSADVDMGDDAGQSNSNDNEDKDEEEGTLHEQNREAAAALFGQDHLSKGSLVGFDDRSPELQMLEFASSPVIAARDGLGSGSVGKLAAASREGNGGSDGVQMEEDGDEKMGVGEGSKDGLRIATHNQLERQPGNENGGEYGNASGMVKTETETSPNNISAAARGAGGKFLAGVSSMQQTGAEMEEEEEDDWAISLQSPETVELEELEDLFDAY